MYIKKKWILVFSFIFVGFLVYFGKNMITSEGKEPKEPEKKTDYEDSKKEEELDKLLNKNKPLIEEEEIAEVTERLDITDMFKRNGKDCKNELKTNELQNQVIDSVETEETLTKTDDFFKEKSSCIEYLMNFKNNSLNTPTFEGAADFKKLNEHEKILIKESQIKKSIKEETKSLKEESDHEDELYLSENEAMLFSVFYLFKEYEKELNSSLMKKDENILNILSFLKGNRKNIKKTYQEFVTLVEIFDEIYRKHDKRNKVACFAQFIINYLVNKDSLALNGIKEHGSDTNRKISSFAKRFCIPIKHNETFYLERYLEINRGDGITIDSDFESITIDFKKYFDEQDCTFLPLESSVCSSCDPISWLCLSEEFIDITFVLFDRFSESLEFSSIVSGDFCSFFSTILVCFFSPKLFVCGILFSFFSSFFEFFFMLNKKDIFEKAFNILVNHVFELLLVLFSPVFTFELVFLFKTSSKSFFGLLTKMSPHGSSQQFLFLAHNNIIKSIVMLYNFIIGLNLFFIYDKKAF
ncbi:hypothetical protein TUBRATIS_003710 [Tubulinosema ratisbonensis]|uniref:Uncharacterized protein n=1 Tax=Tubulinosema ratisbonensis TaxID=291195 RepID=A0A437APN8_9MICR|nr:hypothetical protein TUBRATIS_003710 [Tubulinosema ratisbonensis]